MTLAPAAALKSSTEKGVASDSGERFQSSTGDSTPTGTEVKQAENGPEPSKSESKSKMRGLFGLGKKRAEDKASSSTHTTTKPQSGISSPPLSKDISQLSTRRSAATSPIPVDRSSRGLTSSPARGVSSSSPRMASPATSQIFERDVQESAIMPTSPAIPSHIQTEDHIPPVLDASSEAITDGHLNPDAVEIVTHTSHQPAAVTVTGATPYESVPNSWAEDMSTFSDKDEAASNYGSLDSTDVRRLSFISFADVVMAEHGNTSAAAASSRESVPVAGLTSLSSRNLNRSPSPIRSPVSSQGPETSPPNSKSGSVKGLSMSPTRKPLGSPLPTEHSFNSNNNNNAAGDLNIETMSQALRRTGSTDLSAARSAPISPIDEPARLV